MLTLLIALGTAGAREVTLEEALAIAEESNVENQVADWQVEAARARAHQIRSYYLPTVTVSANALWWDEQAEANLFEGNPCEGIDQAFQAMCNELLGPFLEDPIILHEKTTQQLGVQATQPLTGLYGISQGHRATRSAARAAELARDDKAAAVSLEVVETYFTVLKTQKLVGVAQRAMDALEAHGDRAAAFKEQGLIGRNEVLQLEVASAETALNLRRAEVGVQLASRALALITGAEESSLTPVDVSVESLPALGVGVGDVAGLALRTPAVLALEEQVDAARANRNRTTADLVPQVAAIAQWKKNWGLGSIAMDKEVFVGLGMEWEVWGWGRRYYATREAAAVARQAEAGLAGMQRGAVLQAEAALADARIAREAWEASQVTTAQAAENLAIVSAKYDAHTASMTDLLEAETLSTKAQTDQVNAAFDYLIALARTQAALGLSIDPMAGVDLGAP